MSVQMKGTVHIPITPDPDVDEVYKSAVNARNILLMWAEGRNYDPPIPSEVIAELDYICEQTRGDTQ